MCYCSSIRFSQLTFCTCYIYSFCTVLVYFHSVPGLCTFSFWLVYYFRYSDILLCTRICVVTWIYMRYTYLQSCFIWFQCNVIQLCSSNMLHQQCISDPVENLVQRLNVCILAPCYCTYVAGSMPRAAPCEGLYVVREAGRDRVVRVVSEHLTKYPLMQMFYEF